jgi:glycosyltransferase involved in cell wall biosynthesis
MFNINDCYYFVSYNKELNDGGQSRNRAFELYYKNINFKCKNVFNKKLLIRIFNLIYLMKILLFSRDKKIFIHQNAILLFFPNHLINSLFYRKFIFKLINFSSKKNELIIEVNDLIYEQFIDLYSVKNSNYLDFQNRLFYLKNCKYVFASFEMQKHILLKHNLEFSKTKVIINGANKVEISSITSTKCLDLACLKSNNIKYVYVGTLNMGRQIEELIELFKKLNDRILILIGVNGDWISKIELPNNIFYLGDFDENTAHYIVSKCNIGLIPYDENRFYYNLCFPTKVSFYLTAGIPVLSTPLKEISQYFSKIECNSVKFISFTNWFEVINENILLSNEDCIQDLNKFKNKFNWSDILANLNDYQ